MSHVQTALNIGLTANAMSKQITGTSESSIGRTAIATGTGATLGAITGGAIVISTSAVGFATAPILVPLAVVSGVFAGMTSLFD